MASNTPDSSRQGHPSSRFRSPSLPPIAIAPSPGHSDINLVLRDSNSSKTMTNERHGSVSPPLVDRQEDQMIRDSPVSPRSRSPSTPPLPTVPGTPTSAKPLPSHPTIATENPIPSKNPDRYLPGRTSNMTYRTADKPLNSEKRRSTRRPDSMAPSYTSTVTPSKLRTKGPFDRISTEPNFAQRVFDSGKHDLLYEVDQSSRLPWKFEDVKHGVLDLTTLLRMQQHVLQQKLVAQVNALGQKGAWMEIGVGETMKEYCQLTRDMDYMVSTASTRGATPTTNPFLISTTDALEAQLLEEGGLIARRGLPPATSSTNTTNPSSPTDPTEPKDGSLLLARLPYTPTPAAPWRRHLRHWLAVLSAAVALLLPFLIMMLAPSLASRVAVTSVMVALFALVAAASEVETRRAVAYVLGYAGLLIIFGGLVPPSYWS